MLNRVIFFFPFHFGNFDEAAGPHGGAVELELLPHCRKVVGWIPRVSPLNIQ